MAARGKREAAIAAARATTSCPRCGAPRAAATRTTASSCGLRLPAVDGASPRCGAAGCAALGWYPGDWIWVGAARRCSSRSAGAAVAIALDRRRAARRAAPRSSPRRRLPRCAAQPARADGAARSRRRPSRRAGRRRDDAPGAGAAGPNGRVAWPRDRDGWTIVLVSYPRRARPRRAARDRAPRGAGSAFRRSACSSRPTSRASTRATRSSSAASTARAPTPRPPSTSARATGFGTAYTREISR